MANVELYKVRIENDEGTKAFYPHTSTDVVFNSEGKNVDELLNNKSNADHNHDDKYYTEIEMDTKLNVKLDTTGNASNVTNTFTQATSRANLTTGEKLAVSLGKIMKWFADLKTVAFSGSYADLTNKPTALKNPTAMKVQLNSGTTEGTNQFTYDGSTAKNVNITPSGIGAAASNHNHDTSYSKILDGAGNLLTNVPMMIPKQHFVNPDFQVWQRGESFNITGDEAFHYTADMWCVYASTGQTITVKKTTDGLQFSGTSAIMQRMSPLKVGQKYVFLCKVDGDVKTLSITGGTYTENSFLKYNKSGSYEQFQIKSNGITNIANARLWKGDTIYPIIEEDYSTVLMRCYEKVYSIQFQNYSRLPASFNSENSAYVTIPFSSVMKEKPLLSYSGMFKAQGIDMKSLDISNNESHPNMMVLYVTFNSAVPNWQTTNFVESANLKIIFSCEPL